MSSIARHLRTRWLLVLLASTLAFYAAFIARTRFDVDGTAYYALFDDAMISMRYARHLAEGFGLVWNPGEAPVEGYTNFAWTIALAALHRLGLPEPQVALVVMVAGGALLMANVLVVRAIARQLGLRPATQAAACTLVALCYPLVYWTLRGMEVGALALLMDAAIWLALVLAVRPSAGRALALAGLLGLAVLVRMDAVVSAALIAAFVVLTAAPERRVRLAVGLGGAIAAPLAALTAFRVSYYHDWLPATYYLKVTGVSLLERASRGANSFVQAVFHSLAPILVPIAMAVHQKRLSRHDAGIVLLLAIFAGQAAYSIYVGGDAWEWMNYANRYLTVALPALILAGAALWERVGLRGVLPAAIFGALLPLLSQALERRIQGMGVDYILHPEALVAVLALATALSAGLAYAAARLLRARSAPSLSAALGWLVLVGVGMNGWAMLGWVRENAALVTSDVAATRRGLAIRAHTAPEATIAVAWAGSTPYYACRPAIDLLGKCDPVIAKGPPARAFYPGHNKWNYAYSVGTLKPDLIIEGYHLEAADFALFSRLGYTSPASGLYVRGANPAVDVPALAPAWRAIPW